MTEKYIFLVTELLHMDLYRYTKMVGGQLSEKSVKEIFKWCVQTVQSCHRRNVIHRDLKPENILVNVDKAGNITALRLADFGQSCDSGKPVSRSGKFGTRGYTAPEALVGYRKLDFKIDCWSLGVILYNLVCGGVMPFEGTAQQVKFQTLNRKPEFDDLGWQRLSPSALDLA